MEGAYLGVSFPFSSERWARHCKARDVPGPFGEEGLSDVSSCSTESNVVLDIK